MNKIKIASSIMLIAANLIGHAQKYTLHNEEVIFAFDTKNGKQLTLNKDKENKYIIYHYGTKTKVEFEFPNKTKDSWKKFTYSYYRRGGGVQNEGMDVNHIYFTNKDVTYAIYDIYTATDDERTVGITIVDNVTTKKINIKGNINTSKGSMVGFRENNLLEIVDEPND